MKTRISERERDLLGRIGLHADKSLPEIARITKHHLHTIRYALSRLMEREILHQAWVIDVFQLGWLRIQILFSVGDTNRDKVVKFFMGKDRVVHITEIGGEYDFDIVLLARNTSEVLDLMQEASRACGDIFVTKAVLVQSSIAYFPRKYLCKDKPVYGALVLGGAKKPYVLDEKEQRILESLMIDPGIEKKVLAERVALSIPTINDRITRLKRAGVLVGAMFSSRYIELGVQNYKILISTCASDRKFRDALYKFAYDHPHCTSFRESLGEWDYEVNAEVEGHRELSLLKDELWHHFGKKMGEVHVVPRFKLHKFVSYPVILP